MARGLTGAAALMLALLLGAMTPRPASAEALAFSIDGVGYPRSLFDRRVEARLRDGGRSLQAMRHPGGLKRVQQEVLQRLIEERLLAAEARRRGIVVSEAAIDAAIANRAAAPWLPAEAIRSQVADDLMINALLRQLAADVRIDEARIARQMAQEQRPVLGERIRASHLLLRAPQPDTDAQAWLALEAKANDLRAQATDAQAFAALARTHSQDASASRGGDLGWFERGKMVREFEEAAFDAQPGILSGPVRSPFGVHLILVTGREAAGAIDDAQWRSQIASRLRMEALTARIQQQIDDLRASAKIEVHFGTP